jgi:ABC-type glycerol-3-phosphate transport system permease component
MSFEMRPFKIYFRNSFIYTFLATAGVTISSALVAFGFARLEARGRDPLFVLVLSTMMLPSSVTLIPLYIIYNRLHWIDTLKPLIVPAWFGSAFYIFLLRQFFLTIPRELDEAAIIDGADYLDILVRVILPLSKPVLITVVAFSVVGTWNNFVGPLIYLNSTEKMTVAVGLALFHQTGTGAGPRMTQIVMAAAVISVIPMVITFIACQRYFVTGITMTGIKG